MDTLPLRLHPGADLRRGLEAALAGHGAGAGFVLGGIGSLDVAWLRLAGAAEPVRLEGDFEVLSLGGTVATNGSHLHAMLSDARGQVVGGHVAEGCIVRTTAEVLLAVLPAWEFSRVPDAATGYLELQIRPRRRP